MPSLTSTPIQCELYRNPSLSWLKKTWCELELRACPSFFLSWIWIYTWLKCFTKNIIVIEARKAEKTVGLAILIKKQEKYFGIPYKNQYYLHRTGIKEFDQIWIEYNDFLIDKQDEPKIREKMIEYIAKQVVQSHAIVIGASDNHKFRHMETLGLCKRTLWETKNFALDFNLLRQNNHSILEHLSRNSRYQILRSLRRYQKLFGEISIEKASNAKQAKTMLGLAKPLHLARWSKVGKKSGFANDAFVHFHEMLIETGIETGCIEIYHIKAGSNTLSVMYNFRYNNRIYFYLCAINYQNLSSQFKPGLISHYLLINRAYAEGVALYDFMGGESQYKKTFSNTEGDLSVELYQPFSLRFNLEQHFRASKLKLRQKRARKHADIQSAY